MNPQPPAKAPPTRQRVLQSRRSLRLGFAGLAILAAGVIASRLRTDWQEERLRQRAESQFPRFSIHRTRSVLDDHWVIRFPSVLLGGADEPELTSFLRVLAESSLPLHVQAKRCEYSAAVWSGLCALTNLRELDVSGTNLNATDAMRLCKISKLRRLEHYQCDVGQVAEALIQDRGLNGPADVCRNGIW